MATLDPQIDYILSLTRKAAPPPFWQMTPSEARLAFEKTTRILDVRPVPIFRSEDRVVATTEQRIPVRIYTPREPAPGERLPVLLWLHGGGFVVGSVAVYDALCRTLAKQADCIVAAVDYRLAPEHKFPTAVEDCFAALTWLGQNTDELGADPARIAIGGDSAGGTLASVCAILARDAGTPALIFQLLVYPGTAPAPETASHYEFAEGYFLDRTTIFWFFEQYLRDANDARDFRFAPLLAENLTGLPPALLMVAGFDPLRDEGIAYAERLRQAGNRVELINYEGMTHAFFSFGGAVDVSRQAMAQATAALRAAFG